MMQTLNPYNTARTAAIMARYRPIAPKPEVSPAPDLANSSNDVPDSSMPQNVRNSAYLMNVWPNLQARPTRTRKRGRTAVAPPANKRSRTCLQGLTSPYQVMDLQGKALGFQGFAFGYNGIPQIAFVPNLLPVKSGMDSPVSTLSSTVSLPSFIPAARDEGFFGGIDLNKSTDQNPLDLAFMLQLQGPEKSSAVVNVIAPVALRPVGSSITVGRITDDSHTSSGTNGKQVVKKKPEEVEKEVELQALPVIVSDSYNRVRLTNSAYNEMVGQPECSWLDCMSCGGGGGGGNACKRIGGEVAIEFSDSEVALSSKGFSCWVRIEWGNDKKKRVVNAFCDGIRLACDSKDYAFEWRFHLRETSESLQGESV